MTKTEIKKLFDQYGIYPKKSLGQNFLIEQNIAKKIVKLAEVKKSTTILEIGPGLGGLTQELAKKSRKVIAVEKDDRLALIAKELFKGYPQVKIINQDILEFSPDNLPLDYHLIANLPYYSATPIIRKFLQAFNQPLKMVLLVQKEVGQRICRQPPKMNLLAVSVRYYAQAKLLGYVSKNCFWPKPQVESAILEIIPQKKFSEKDKRFFELVRAGFSAPRKQLANNLKKQLKISREQTKKALGKMGLREEVRAENLSVQDWQKLVEELDIGKI